MACERFRDALTDVAAGAPAPAPLEAHLAACEACRAELDVLRQALSLADAEMAGLASGEPSPELAVRIRQAVAEAEPSPAWRFGWVWPTVAAAATLLVALAVWVGRTPVIPRDLRLPGPEGSAVPPAGPSHVDKAERARGDSLTSVVHGRRPAPTRAASIAAPREPEVLVPPGEAEALLRFATLVHRDRHAPAAFLAVGEPSGDLPEPVALVIKPLEIVPLDPAETSGT